MEKRFAYIIFFAILAIAGGAAIRAGYELRVNVIPRMTAELQANAVSIIRVRDTDLRPVAEDERTILFVGDIMLSRGVAYEIERHGGDPRYPFLFVMDAIRSADLAFGNLEGPISDKGVNQGSIYSFRADPAVAEGLVAAGFDVLSFANNHSFDWGLPAFEDTLDILSQNGVRPVGAGRNYEEANAPVVLRAGEARVAFLAYTTLYPRSFEARKGSGISSFALEDGKERVRGIRARNEADVIIVSFHWGNEYETSANSVQKEIARALIDAGADVVVGHHPHVVQEIERYRGGWILYSLGNFVFDQGFSEATMRGLAAELLIRGTRAAELVSIPVSISPSFQPKFLDGVR